MPIFGQKKSRTTRAATIRDTSSYLVRLQKALRDRGVIGRLLICVLAMIGLVLSVEGWKPAFPYRLGDRAEQGILAKTDFGRVNLQKTEEAIREAREQILPNFGPVPKILTDLPLPDQLHRDLRNIAEAESLETLSDETKIAFGATDPPSTQATTRITKEEFQTLLNHVSSGEGARDRIDEIVEDFKRFIEPLEEHDRIDPAELKANDIPIEQTIVIIEDGKKDGESVAALDVLLKESFNETGYLGKRWVNHPELAGIRSQLENWLIRHVPFTLEYKGGDTEDFRRESEKAINDIIAEYLDGDRLPTTSNQFDDETAAVLTEVLDEYHTGETLLTPGEHIDEETLTILYDQYEALVNRFSVQQHIQRVGITILLILVLMILNGYYIVRYESHLVDSAARLGIFLTVVVVAVCLGRLLSFDPWRAEIIPLTATVMVFAIVYNQVLATLTGFALALVITLSTGGDLGHFVVLMSVAATAVIPLARVPSRSTIIKVGFLAGAAFFVVTWGTRIIASQTLTDVWNDFDSLKSSLKGAAWCVAAGYLVAGSLPFIESTFGVVTNISLLEMSDVSHPLLQELVQRAPGTYNHSMAVATIGETAADRIGANGLLVRVGAYFHDIGKMLKPDYFIENMSEGAESRHEHLAPAMSTLIIIGHVKDGADLGMQHNLPQTLIDFIEQHHGTTLVEYFYNEATKQAIHRPDHKTDVEESSFRYPGPKPQTREAGVMMLADAVESATRTLDEPTPKRIEGLVEKLTMKRLLDGQLDESSLTLTEIKTIQDSLTKSLIGIYHGRIKYPEQRTA
jgi:putative nucleotidyltransferase with HDIG domain